MRTMERSVRFVASALLSLTAVMLLSFVVSSGTASANHTRTNSSNPLVGFGSNDPFPSAWSYWDSKGTGSNSLVDWPASYMFWNDAEVDKIKNGMCNLGQNLSPYSKFYCGQGGWMRMKVIETDGTLSWDDDAGHKLGHVSNDFLEGCPSIWREHMRLYGPRPNWHSVQDRFYHPAFGYFVIGTTHLDFNDSPGCFNRHNGYPDVAENWFAGPLDQVNGWTVDYQCCYMWANSDYVHSQTVLNPSLSGSPMPGSQWTTHYGNNQVQTKVFID